MEGCTATSFVELRRTFSFVDQGGNKTVFNVGGNRFRVVVVAVYVLGQMTITHVLTHREYDEGSWK